MARLHRHVSLAATALFLATAAGCGGTWDELEKANAEVGKKKPAAEEAATKSPAEMAREKSGEWWQQAKSLVGEEVDPSVVSCRLDERMQFMRRQDCLARGGRVI